MADEKTTPAAPEAPQGPAKRKKINALTTAEIDAALVETKAKQGGLLSRYARQLIIRKKALAAK